MKQLNHLPKNSLDPSDKDSTKKRSSPSDNPHDPYVDDTARSSSNSGKHASNFDHSNFALFFNPKKAYPRSSNDSALSQAGQLHLKKKSHEATSSKESSLKRMSSKDSSNIEELCENTSIINYPIESKPSSSKPFNEPFFPKGGNDEYLELLQDDSSRRKERGQRRSPEEGSFSEPIKLPKEEKLEQEFIENIFKMAMRGEEQEQEKVEAFKLPKPKPNYNIEVIERIKTKALHPHRNSMLHDPSPQNMSISSTSAFENDQSRVRTNNNSVFQGTRPLKKEHSVPSSTISKESYEVAPVDPLRKSISALFPAIESETPAFQLEGQTPIKGPMPAKTPTSLLTKSLEAKDITRSQKKMTAQKNNLSTVASDSALDGDYLATLPFNHPNTSFSTPFSVKSNSFNNSGKTDFNSPLQADSGKLAENYKVPNVNISHRQSVPALPFQRTLFNVEQNLMVFYGGHGSGNNTDRSSNSFSWGNEEYSGSAFSSAIGTPQGMHQQNFFNQSLNITPSIDHQNISQPIGSQTVMSRSNSNFTSINPTINQSIHQNTSKFSGPKATKDQNVSFTGKPSNEANQSRSSKKKSDEQKNSSSYEIDVYRIELNPKTTLMVKNIPNKYDLPMLLEAIDKNHKGKYDFLYLPIDPRNKCNVGYYFINFTQTKYIRDFYLEFNAKKWERFNSEKICDIKYARIQGKKNLMHHFQYSNVMNQQDKKVKPYIPNEYELLDNQTLFKELVTKQKKHKHTIGAMEVLYFDQAELQKTKGNKTSFASMGPLSVLYFKKGDRFVLRLNDWMYPLMSKLPITRCDKGGMKEMMLEMPALNGFTYKLKIMGELNPNLMANMEMILSHCCGLMDKEKKMMNQEIMSPTMKMSGEESPEKMEMSERAMRTMQEAKETIQMMKERAMAKAADIMSRRKMLNLKMMKNRNFRMEAKSRIKDYCMQSEKATQEFMNMRKMNPNLTQARSLDELKKMDAKMPMMFIRREELDMAMMNNREIVNPGTKKTAMMEIKKMMEEKMGTGMTSQRTPQKKSSVLGWFKKSLSGIKDAFDDMMGKSTGKSMTDLTDQDLMKSSPEREKMMPQEKETQGEVHDTNYMKIDNPIPMKTEMPREQRNEQRMPMRQGQERRNQPRGGMMEEKMPEMMMEGGMEHYQG